MPAIPDRSAPEAVPVRDAATVMLVRDLPAEAGPGIEVFMLRRNLRSVFVAGAYVFPGGAVDIADQHADLGRYCAGRSDTDASELLAIERGGLAFWVAAIRECFEEAGVLLAYDRHGRVLSLADAETEERFADHRLAVDDGERTLVEICAEEDLTLAVDRMHYFSHWITPVGAPRRYDTRFFVTAAPAEQVPLHDNRETIAGLWIKPEDALARFHAGELELIFPTVRNLEAIGRFDRTQDLLEAAARIESVPAILPRVVADAHGTRIVLPGDPAYDDLSTVEGWAGGAGGPVEWPKP